ncbi:site-specific integrase, partial [Geobacter sp.]
METAIASFLRHLETERNASHHTREAYRSDLEQFRQFVGEELGPAAAPGAVTHLLIRRWLARLHRSHQKSSIGRKLAAVRALFKYLVRTGSLARNPAELVSTPKREKKVPYHLNIDEATTLVEAPRAPGLLSLRDRAILETLYSCGLRVSELTGLDVGGL